MYHGRSISVERLQREPFLSRLCHVRPASMKFLLLLVVNTPMPSFPRLYYVPLRPDSATSSLRFLNMFKVQPRPTLLPSYLLSVSTTLPLRSKSSYMYRVHPFFEDVVRTWLSVRVA